MRKIPLAEWFLSQDIGKERATAIMGDLEELAGTRGRLWFWTTYSRTLISTGWRAPMAFLAGTAGFWAMMSFFLNWTRTPESTTAVYGSFRGTLASLSTYFLVIFSFTLWFAAPYTLFRFGYRDRIAQLYCAFLLLATPVLLRSNATSTVCALLLLTIIMFGLFSSIWRMHVVVLTTTSVAVLTSLELCIAISTKIYHPHIHDPLGWFFVRLASAIGLVIAAAVCTRLHRWLLEQPRAEAAPSTSSF